MTEPEKAHYTTKAHAAGAFVLLSRLLVALIAATVSLSPHARVLAQQPATTKKEAATTQPGTVQSDDAGTIRLFHVHVPQEALDDLRRRIAATRLPDQETVSDRSQGVQLATMKELMRYWQADYDWRKAEAKLNALPQFVTTIDGVDIHFIHVRSKHPNVMPLIMTHGGYSPCRIHGLPRRELPRAADLGGEDFQQPDLLQRG